MSNLEKEQKKLDYMIETDASYDEVLKQSQLLDKYISIEMFEQFEYVRLEEVDKEIKSRWVCGTIINRDGKIKCYDRKKGSIL